MPDVVREASLFQEIDELKRRIADLERSAQIQKSTIFDGKVNVLNTDLEEVAFLGKYDNALGDAESIGLKVQDIGDDSTQLWVDGYKGFLLPWMYSSWNQRLDFKAVTSATWDLAWEAQAELISAYRCKTRVLVTADASTDGEVRFQINDGTTWACDARTITGGEVTTFEFSWETWGKRRTRSNFVHHGRTENIGSREHQRVHTIGRRPGISR